MQRRDDLDARHPQRREQEPVSGSAVDDHRIGAMAERGPQDRGGILELRGVVDRPAPVRPALRAILDEEEAVADDFPPRMGGEDDRLGAGAPAVIEKLAGEGERGFAGDVAAFSPFAVRVNGVARPERVQDASHLSHRRFSGDTRRACQGARRSHSRGVQIAESAR